MPQPPRAAPRTGKVIATLALAGVAAAVMQTLVTPLLVDLPKILHTSPSNAAWVITATLLVAGVCVPISGRLGDMVGKRRMMLACCVPLIAGSVVCALSSSVVPMIAGRGLQGIGMGMIPLGIALLRDILPAEKLSSSIGLVSASMGIGGGIGLPLSAAVAQYANWRFLFWGAAVLASAVAVMIVVFVPDVPAGAKGQRFDAVGALGLAVGLVCLLLFVSKGSDWGWGSATALGLVGAAVVVLGAWGWFEWRTTDPLVDLRTTVRPRVLLTNLASVFIGFGMYASMLVVPQLLQFPAATGYGLGQSMLAAGLWMLPGGLMMMAVSPLGGRLTNARGPKVTLVCGALVLAAGYGTALLLAGTAAGLMVAAMVINCGVALAYGAMPALVMSAVPPAESGAANGFNALMRSLGTSVGAAVVGVVLARMTTTVGGVTFTSEAGFRTGLLMGGGFALVSGAVAAFIPAPRPQRAGPRDASGPAAEAAQTSVST
ncbi:MULTISPECIES: MFS transporter [unclassified Streptomyces]|uniref:MFS transporter n=1 Tax=unclassified Streptomyces TaxID=2593676 RepID=UPI000DC7EC85|nr:MULTISPECIES: MFS transporter [unclassified Streptomyces]AWZ09072.1 MFS transporter [Streptomyces sp. ICC4]AWZ15931.1 MFS transporter [Streptomyces sp. ICC1]